MWTSHIRLNYVGSSSLHLSAVNMKTAWNRGGILTGCCGVVQSTAIEPPPLHLIQPAHPLYTLESRP